MSQKSTPHGGRKTKEELNEHGLTAMQEEFCHAYLVRFNISKAEKALGLPKGVGSKWMTQLKVRERINKIRIDTGKAFDVTRERLLQELMNIIYADPKLYKGYDIVKWPDEEVAAISEIEYDLMGGVNKIKRWDKLKAMEMVNKMLGFNMPELSKVLPSDKEPMNPKEVIEIAKLLKDAV